MSEEKNKVGLDIKTTYDGKGVDQAVADQKRLTTTSAISDAEQKAAAEKRAAWLADIEKRKQAATRATTEAQADLREETEKGARAAQEAAQHMTPLRNAVAGVGTAAATTSLAILAVTATLAAAAREQEKLDRLVNRTQARLGFGSGQLGYGRGDVERMIRDLSRQPGVDQEGAAGILMAAGGPGIDEAAYQRAIRLANDFAVATGMTAAQAAKTLAEAAREPEKQLAKLDDQYNFLTVSQRASVDQFIANGEKAKALEVAMGVLESRIGGLANGSLTPLESQLNRLGNAWDGAWERIEKSEAIERANARVSRLVAMVAWLLEPGDTEDRDLSGKPRRAKNGSGGGTAPDPDAKKPPVLMGPTDAEIARLYQDRNSRRDAAARAAKSESDRRGRESLQGYLAGMKFDQDTQQEIDRAVADMEKRLKQREYYENIYGSDITDGKTTAELAAYHQQQLAAIDAGIQQEENLMRLNAGFDEHGRALKGVNDEYKALTDAIEGWGRDSSRAIAKWAISGKGDINSVKDALANFAEELLAMQIQRKFMDPALKGATSWIESINWGGIFGGGGTHSIPDSYGAGLGVAYSHAGSGPGDILPRRYVHPAVFDYAPRAHSGIGPNERPMVITKDESVLTPGQMRALDGPRNVTINVINQTGTPVEAQASAPRFDGESMVVDLFLRRLSRDGGARDQMRRMLSPPV